MEASESKVPTILGHEYGKMPDPVTALKCARHIIVEEKRWTTGHLMVAPTRPSRTSDDSQPLTCTNVKVCAVGALVLVVGDGPAVERYFNGIDDDDEESTELAVLGDHPVGKRALIVLSTATRKIEHETADLRSVTTAVNDVEQFNDTFEQGDYGGEEHLNRVISAFDLAIELANSIIPEDPPAAA